MKLSEESRREMKRLADSGGLRADMEVLRRYSESPFFRGSFIDRDAYVDFVMQFNEFINHRPKPFKPMIDRVMKL